MKEPPPPLAAGGSKSELADPRAAHNRVENRRAASMARRQWPVLGKGDLESKRCCLTEQKLLGQVFAVLFGFNLNHKITLPYECQYIISSTKTKKMIHGLYRPKVLQT